MSSKRDYYDILGVGKNATPEEIKYTFNEAVYGVLDLPLGGEEGPSRILDVETNEYRR